MKQHQLDSVHEALHIELTGRKEDIYRWREFDRESSAWDVGQGNAI
jgi:hypothetical protein